MTMIAIQAIKKRSLRISVVKRHKYARTVFHNAQLLVHIIL